MAEMKAKAEKKADIYFNGKFVGESKSPRQLVDSIRKKRRMNLLPPEMNISYHPEFKEVRISTEYGRVRRPLIVVEAGRPKLTAEIAKKVEAGKLNWNYLIEHGIVEYLDAEEEEDSYIAMSEEDIAKDHTHLEIDPVAMMGISAAIIPYPEYNRGDRINYGAKMVGQSIGLMTSNFLIRTDTKFNVLTYPQSPLVETYTSDMVNAYPGGQNIVIAIMCGDGYNLNDAVILNKSSIERGMFRSFYFRTYETIKKRYWGGQEDEITVPEAGIRGHRGEDAYKDLGEDGIINPETPVTSDSVLLGKVSPLRFLSAEEFTAEIDNKRETSLSIRHGEKGVVDRILITETPDGNQMFKVTIRDERIPEIGDKFASRHGQKGVVSILLPEVDMPFSQSGVIPDVIFNPHAIPSRMTIGHMLEIMAGKAGAMAGKKMNATAFNHTREPEIRKMMQKLGFSETGKEVLHDGRTGQSYEVMIFTGIQYYMKLDHMVANKLHSRSRGPVTLLTKQPTEGRSKRGGLRIGEMEQQCLVGHGAVLTLKERFDSDKSMVPICTKCGLLAIHDFMKNRNYCPVCKESSVTWVETSYAFKLTIDELTSMGIYPQLTPEEI